jgi:hypothetical protein
MGNDQSVVVSGPSSATSSMESASNAYSNAVMTRSRSVRNQLLEDNESRHQLEKSYLPKMQGNNHGGIVMPSMHNNHNSGPAGGGGGGGGSGAESPQWGWYINTTVRRQNQCSEVVANDPHRRSNSHKHSLLSVQFLLASYPRNVPQLCFSDEEDPSGRLVITHFADIGIFDHTSRTIYPPTQAQPCFSESTREQEEPNQFSLCASLRLALYHIMPSLPF